jgi:hypothetical protein
LSAYLGLEVAQRDGRNSPDSCIESYLIGTRLSRYTGLVRAVYFSKKERASRIARCILLTSAGGAELTRVVAIVFWQCICLYGESKRDGLCFQARDRKLGMVKLFFALICRFKEGLFALSGRCFCDCVLPLYLEHSRGFERIHSILNLWAPDVGSNVFSRFSLWLRRNFVREKGSQVDYVCLRRSVEELSPSRIITSFLRGLDLLCRNTRSVRRESRSRVLRLRRRSGSSWRRVLQSGRSLLSFFTGEMSRDFIETSELGSVSGTFGMRISAVGCRMITKGVHTVSMLEGSEFSISLIRLCIHTVLSYSIFAENYRVSRSRTLMNEDGKLGHGLKVITRCSYI